MVPGRDSSAGIPAADHDHEYVVPDMVPGRDSNALSSGKLLRQRRRG